MALSLKNIVVDTSVGTSQHTRLTQSEPPSSSAESSDDFSTAREGSCPSDSEDSDTEDLWFSSSSEPTSLNYSLMYFSSELGTDLEAEIEASRDYWSEVSTESPSVIEEETETDKLEVIRSLRERYGAFFMEYSDQFNIGQKIAEGGQAEIFEVFSSTSNEDSVVKLFKEGNSLRTLQKQWPRNMLRTLSSKNGGAYFNHYSSHLYGGMLLNGRFAFWMPRYWGDLRKLIDIKMQNNPDQGPIFTDSRVFHNMLEIANGMRDLHKDGIVHKDLKASNVLIQPFETSFHPIHGYFLCKVADYECSVGVIGTGFWRAPEILLDLKNGKVDSNLFTEKSDVYSYGMTCYEILTGRIPFNDFPKSNYDFVCNGERPELPRHIKPPIKKLLKRCWHQEPSQRPTFQGIINFLCKDYKLDSHAAA